MISEHISYARDTIRTALFEKAAGHVIRQNDHVLDLGCGIGILGLICLRQGAGQITAIDDTPIAEVAAQIYAKSDYAGCSEVLRGRSHHIRLPKPVDVIVCDHVGYFGLDYGILSLLKDARSRFLKNGGCLMPAGLALYLAPVGGQECVQALQKSSLVEIPEDFRWLQTYVVNSKHAVDLRPEAVLGTPEELGAIDFYTETREFFSWKQELTITRPGIFHGLAGWFECALSKDVSMTNSPLSNVRIDRSQAFFPIEGPMQVEPGDMLRTSLSMRPDEGSFAWSVEHLPSGKRFRHSSLQGDVLGTQDILASRSVHVPVPTETAKAGAIILNYCDGEKSVHEIKAEILQDHPDLFPTQDAADDFISDWLATWTR